MSDTLITGDMEALDMAFNMYILLCSLHRERDGEACGTRRRFSGGGGRS